MENTPLEQLETAFLAQHKVSIPKIPEKTFYAPELSQELLVNYLARTNDTNIEQPFNNFDLSIAFRNAVSTSPGSVINLEKQLNDWTIQGFIRYWNQEANIIALPVVLSTNRILEITKQGKDNQYAIELATLRYLYGEYVNLAVIAIDRLFTNYKTMPTKMVNFIEITDTYSDAEIEQMLLLRTTELTKHLDSNSKTIPPICSNLRWHRKNGKSTCMSCAHYCNYSHVCKYANPKNSKARISKDSIIF